MNRFSVGFGAMKYRSQRPFVCALGLAAVLAGCSPTTPPSTTSTPMAQQTMAPDASATPAMSATPVASLSPDASASPTVSGTPSAALPAVEGLVVTVVKPGSGTPIASGTVGSFHYTGWLDKFENGEPFDSSVGRDPFRLNLGAGEVIPGWDQGLVGMTPGEVRRLEIAPELAYGPDGRPPVIPPNSTLYFEVEYLGPPTP